MSKITLADIKKDNKVYSQKQKVELADGKYAFIYPHFSPTKMTELIKEMVTDHSRAKEVGIDFEAINMSDWALFNIIYKFSDLGIPSDIKKKVESFYLLIDWEHFEDLINAFPQESISKFSERMIKISENINKLLESQQLTKEDIENIVEEEIDQEK